MLDTLELGANARHRPSGVAKLGEFDSARGRTVGDTPRQEQLDLAPAETSASAATAAPSEPVQGGLFPDDSLPDELVGYRGPSAC